MFQPKLISIIIPIYNCEQHLEKCIKSIQNQTYTHLEILLIDDGSTDSSGEICDNYSKEDVRIKVFHCQNGGVSAARNFGINHANGEYIAFVDSDDYLLPEMYEKLINKANETDSDMVFCRYQAIDSKGVISEETSGIERFIKEKDLSLFIVHTKDLIMGTCWRSLYKRSFVLPFKFNTDLILGEDLVFMLQLLTSTQNISFVPDVLYNYFFNGNTNYLKYIKNPKYLSSQKLLLNELTTVLKRAHREDLACYQCWHVYNTTIKSFLASDDYHIGLDEIKNDLFWKGLNSIENYRIYSKQNRSSRLQNKLGNFLIRHHLFNFYKLLNKLRGGGNG